MKIFIFLLCLLPLVMAEDKECPEPNGLFSSGDKAKCGQYKNCAGGKAHVVDCPDGLAFSQANGRCDWPDQVEECDAEAYLGFKCPDPPTKTASEFTKHASPSDNTQYFVCVQGKPRRMGCPKPQTFNAEKLVCEG